MEPAGAAGAGSPHDAATFGFPTQRRQGASKPSHRRAASSPAIDHDFGRSGSSMYSSGPFGVLGDPSNGLFSPRLAIGLSKGHRETASGDFTMSTEAGDTSFGSSVDSLFHRGGLESLRSDFLKMDLGRRRISEDERERVGHHSGAESADTVSLSPAGGNGSGSRASLPRSLGTATSGGSTGNLEVSSGDLIRRPSDRTIVTSSDTTLRMLSSGGTASTTLRRSPSAGASMDSNANGGSSVGVSAVLGGQGGSGGGVGPTVNGGGGGDPTRGLAGRGQASGHQNHHAGSNGRSSGGGGTGSGGRAGAADRDRDRRQSGGGSSGGGGGSYRNHSSGGGRPSAGNGGQTWMNSSGAVDDGYSTYSYRDTQASGGGGGNSGLSSQSPPPGGAPMYALHGDGYSTIPIQYALNGDSYAHGVVGHVPQHPQPQHGLGQMQGSQGGSLDGSVGDQQLLAPQHVSGMGSPPHPPMPTPQHLYMSAQGTYVLASGNGAGSNGNSAGNGASGSSSGNGGSGGRGGHLQSSGSVLQPPMMVYGHKHQGGNAPPQRAQQHQQQQRQQHQQQHQQPPSQQSQSTSGSTEAAAHATATQMYLPMSQAGYGYVPPHINHLQTAGGVPIYQMAGPTLDSAPPAGVRTVAGGGGAGVSGGNRGSPGSPTLVTPAAASAQGFQVHYALTPQGIVPMVPIMPNGAGGFTNPALYTGIGGVYDGVRGAMGMGVIAGIAGGMDGLDDGRMSPPLTGGAPMHPRYAVSPPPHLQAHAHHPHPGMPGAMQPMHAPAWSVGGAGPHDGGTGYHDVGGYNDRGYGGTGAVSDGFRRESGPRDARMPRDADPGKDVKDRRKRLDRESDMAALLEATRPALKDVLGKVYSMSRDQVGCRLLQQKLDECPDRPPDGDAGKEGGAGGEEDAVSAIFEEALPDLPQMMVDPFGNYLFQKLFVKIDDHQRLLAVEAVTERMAEAAVNLHGTRCVQKIVELCRTDAQAAVIARSLGPSVVKLSLDPNGNHVVQRALQHMPEPRNDFVLEAITASLVQVAVHRHGCCVLQRCLDAAGPKLRIKLVDEVARNGLKLMQDPFGNYVVQYVLKTCSREETYMLCSAPLGHVASLSTQKFSSNVMEACLERALPEVQSKFVEELAQQGRIRELILDQYANYVVQRALTVANNEEGLKLVAAIRPHLHSMQSTSSGRRIAAKIIKRYPTVDLGEEILMLMSRG